MKTSRARRARDGYEPKVINGVPHVWSILDNCWVSLDYWRWVNGRTEDRGHT